MRILFIGNTRIGDFILSSGLIAHLLETYSDARLTIACGYLCEPLTRHIPQVDRVISMRKRPLNQHWIDLWHEVRGTRWDLIIDLRNSFVSRFARKKKVYRLIRPTGHLHKVEEAARVMGLSPAPNPKIWIGDDDKAYAREMIPEGRNIIGIGPGASHLFKRWPAERFAELCKKLTASDGLYPNARIAIMGSPEERMTAQPIFDRLPQDQLIDLVNGTDLLRAAAVLERCALYIGNDNGLMHMSAAMGTRTIGLFGPTAPALYGPWGKSATFVCSERPQAELEQIKTRIGPDAECLMEELSIASVSAIICNGSSCSSPVKAD